MTERKSKILKTIVTVAFVGMLMILAFNRRTIRVEQYSLDYMGTATHIIVFAKNENLGNQYIVKAMTEISRIEKMMSYHDPNSELSNINRCAFGKPVVLSNELFELLTKSVEYYKASGGKFDVTITPLLELWRNSKSAPTDKEFEHAIAKVGTEKLILDANESTIRFGVEGMLIDLGGIAKGYAIDRAVEVLKNSGAKGGMVDIGGDLRCFGFAPASGGYIVGLQNPAAVDDVNQPELIAKFEIMDMAVATSGDYRRYVEIDGERVSHILDPSSRTGAKNYSSVSVLAKSAIDADALATSISLMSKDNATGLLESLTDTEAVMITKSGEMIKTSGADEYILSE